MVFGTPMIFIMALSWFWRCKECLCPLGIDLGLLRMLEVHDWGLKSGSWFGHGQWYLIYPCSKFWLYLDFEGTNNIHFISVLIWGFEGCWMFLIGDLDLYLHLYMGTGLRYTHVLNFGSLSWFSRCKEHPSPLSPALEALKDAGGSWLVFDASMLQIWAIYLDFEVADNIHVL